MVLRSILCLNTKWFLKTFRSKAPEFVISACYRYSPHQYIRGLSESLSEVYGDSREDGPTCRTLRQRITPQECINVIELKGRSEASKKKGFPWLVLKFYMKELLLNHKERTSFEPQNFVCKLHLSCSYLFFKSS